MVAAAAVERTLGSAAGRTPPASGFLRPEFAASAWQRDFVAGGQDSERLWWRAGTIAHPEFRPLLPRYLLFHSARGTSRRSNQRRMHPIADPSNVLKPTPQVSCAWICCKGGMPG
jgi:hypothetical protein